MLSAANRAALAAVRTRAERERPRHLARIARVLGAAGVEAARVRGSGRATCA